MLAEDFKSFTQDGDLRHRREFSSIDDLYSAAEDRMKALNLELREFFTPLKIDPEDTPLLSGEPLDHVSSFLTIHLKGKIVVKEEVEDKHDGVVSSACDIVRAELVLINEAQVAEITSYLLATCNVIAYKNYFAQPHFTGYRVAHMVVDVDGFMCVVDIHLLSILALKPARDKSYNYFRDIFVDEKFYHDTMSSVLSDLGHIGSEKGKGKNSIFEGVLKLLRLGGRWKLETLIKLCSAEVFDDPALELEACKSLVPILERGYEAGTVTEVELYDGVLELGRAHGRMKEFSESNSYLKTALDGFKRLLGEGEKSIETAYIMADQVQSSEERLKEVSKQYILRGSK